MASRLPNGTCVGLIKTKIQSAVLRQEIEDLPRGQSSRLFYERFEDFDQATLPSPWATKVVGTTPTVTKTANALCGIWRAILDTTSEAETAGGDVGDSLRLHHPTRAATQRTADVHSNL